MFYSTHSVQESKRLTTLLKISGYHFCVKILQDIFNLYAGRGEEAVNSQVPVYFYSLQFCKMQVIWGRRQLIVIKQGLGAAHP